MRRRREGEKEGTQRWLLTYADMISLLAVFFIMLYAMSIISMEKFMQLAISVRAGFGGEVPKLGGGLLPERGGRVRPSIKREVGVSPVEIAAQIKKYVKAHKLTGKVSVWVMERGIRIRLLTDGLLFPKGEATLTPRSVGILSRIANLIRGLDAPIRVEGHTCDLPIHTAKFPSNWELSAARAAAVARFLISRGVEPRRIQIVGYADTRPIVPNTSESNRRLNRRVEIYVLKGGRAK